MRATAASLVAEVKPADAVALLTAAWQTAKADVEIDARVAILEALVALEAEPAKALLTESLAGKLAGCGGMAGNDATSADFAGSYDVAAREALGSLADLTHAFIGLGRLLSATGANHATAEASAAGRVLAYTGRGLDDTFVRVSPEPPPSSVGASISPPSAAVVMLTGMRQ